MTLPIQVGSTCSKLQESLEFLAGYCGTRRCCPKKFWKLLPLDIQFSAILITATPSAGNVRTHISLFEIKRMILNPPRRYLYLSACWSHHAASSFHISHNTILLLIELTSLRGGSKVIKILSYELRVGTYFLYFCLNLNHNVPMNECYCNPPPPLSQ